MMKSKWKNYAFLLFALQTACAADTPPQPSAPPTPPPQRWQRAIPVSVVVGADVGIGAEARLFPSTVLLRVKEPGRMGDVGRNASDCIVEASGYGHLSAERVNLSLRMLRCYDDRGVEVTTRAIHGYAVDSDVKAGIRGVVNWSQSAKDLLMIGVGTREKENFLARATRQALSRATQGLADSLLKRDENQADPNLVEEVRNAETLMPVLSLEQGREFDIVLLPHIGGK
ncbi:hypothetical protein [Chitinimonas lacunae]|uniref:Uncharacterized protein n=1 Tax=Chitinimonas lacunae TaxID=1963018 RepID=A0ABV8MNT4_9NEIS